MLCHPMLAQISRQVTTYAQMSLKLRRNAPALQGMSPLHTRLPHSFRLEKQHALLLLVLRRSVLNSTIAGRTLTRTVPVAYAFLRLFLFCLEASGLPLAYSFPLSSHAFTTCWYASQVSTS